MLNESYRGDRSGARLGLAGLEVPKPDHHMLLEGGAQRLERGLAHPQARRVPQDGLVGSHTERPELQDCAAGLPRQRPLAPDHRGQVQQRGLFWGEADVRGQLIVATRDAVPQVLVVAGVIRRLDSFERHTEFTDVVFIALELSLEANRDARLLIPLAVALHGGEDLRLGQPRFGGEERENEAEETLFNRNPGRRGRCHEGY